jgi:hypothetical protein
MSDTARNGTAARIPSADAESLDWLLGQLDRAEQARVAAANAADPALARRTHELDATLARMRTLTAPPGGPELLLRLRYSVARRLQLRPLAAPARARWQQTWRVACVAAIVLGATLLGESLWARMAAPSVDVGTLPLPQTAAVPRPAPTLSVDVDAYGEPAPPAWGWARGEDGFFAHVDALRADAGADAVLSWLGARNALDALRMEFRQRFSQLERQSLLAATGAHATRELRVQTLAAAVADKLSAMLAAHAAHGDADPFALALGLRALLASGSSRAVGEHRHLVRQTADVLLARLTDQEPADVTVSFLAALTDVAVVSGGRESEVIRHHAERIARATANLGSDRRPLLLQRHTRLSSLADAGYVLRLAPAFGASTTWCARARRLVLAHLRERLDGAVERPEVIAAMLCGFGDMVDLADLDARLLLWDARQLLPDYLALLHYAWGQYPVRRGWASFQDDLRYLSTLPTPVFLIDTAALLMTLATNFAAPGSLELLARR